MKNTLTLTCSKQKYTFQVLSQFKVEVEVYENPYELPADELYQMAARINKKRSFLFVSKVLGKHIPIDPKKGLLTGALLANRYMEKVRQTETGVGEGLLSSFLESSLAVYEKPFIKEKVNPVIIGFAETATALGHAFFQAFEKADYFHTTREMIPETEPVITFEEEHSHATSHRCYINESLLNNDREIILVDDEITTGKTAINIIRSIHNSFPRKTYTVVSILDWRSEQDQCKFDELEKELGIIIHSVSLLKGKISLSGSPNIGENPESPQAAEEGKDPISISTIYLDKIFPGKMEQVEYTSMALGGETREIPYLKGTGRFGISAESHAKAFETLKDIGGYLSKQRTGGKTLCLGTGEFMYLPMVLASLMGEGIRFHSTTRSPIYIEKREDYGAQYGIAFPNPEDRDIAQFVYNIPPYEYDELFLFYERELSFLALKPFLTELEKTNIKTIKVVFFNGGMEDE